MDIITDNIVKARKEHKCDYCRKTIKVGEKYRSSFIADGGDCWTWAGCNECEAFVDKFNLSGCGDGLTTMMFEDAVYALCYQQKMFLDERGRIDTKNHTIHEMVVEFMKERT